MEKITKKYVEYLYPGLIVSETNRREIDHSDPTKVTIDKNVIGFRFIEQEFIMDGEEEFTGKEKNVTNWFYIGKRLTLAEIKARFGNDPKYSILIDNMKYNKIASVCMTQCGNFMPMGKGDVTLDEYINEKNQGEQVVQMFTNLKKHIGEMVTCQAWRYGGMIHETDELKEVNFFTNVEIGSSGIPFVGYGAAISRIVLKETGEVLYENPYIEYGYDRRQPVDIELAKRKIYGNAIVDKQRDRRIKAEEKRKLAMEQADSKARKKKYTIMKDGIPFIKSELVEEWMEYVDNNTNDAYSCCVAETSLLCLKKLSEGASFNEIEKIYMAMGLTGFMAGAISSVIAYFSHRGSEFKNNWNQKFGIAEEQTEGTVNPTVLTLDPPPKK